MSRKLNYLMTRMMGVMVLASQALYANQSIDPVTACNYLAEEKFRGSMEYRQNKKTGMYSCLSLHKPINKGEPARSDVQYRVSGNASEARLFSLSLRMNSPRLSTPVLREFQKYSDKLYQKNFGESLPAEIQQAIFSAIRGEWNLHGHKIKLSRIHDKAITYELVFSIEKLDGDP